MIPSFKRTLIALFAACVLMNQSIAETAQTTPVAEEHTADEAISINANLKLVSMELHEENTQLFEKIDVSFPQIKGESLPASAMQFNKLVRDMVERETQQFKNDVKIDMPHMQTLPVDVKQNSLLVDYDIDVVRPGKTELISVRLSIESMQAGRAHPYHKKEVLNYNLTTGKIVALKDLFKPSAKYLNIFSKYANKKLNGELQDKWMIEQGTAPSAKNYQIWSLQDDGILITFNEYQVAPYANGPQEVNIPYSSLKPVLSARAPVMPCVDNAKSCGVV